MSKTYRQMSDYTKEDYFELNNNSNSLNTNRIMIHFLDYFQDVMFEHLDRDMKQESKVVSDLKHVINHLSSLEQLIERVETLKSQKVIKEESTIILECISGSNCKSYDKR